MTEPLTITIKAVVPERTRIDVGVLLALEQAAKQLMSMPGTKQSHIARASRWLAESYEAGEGIAAELGWRDMEIDRLRARVAELEQIRTHAGVDICEVAAAVEVVRALEIVSAVRALVSTYNGNAFQAGFETACDEIEHRLKPCEHCDAAQRGAFKITEVTSAKAGT